MTAIDPSQLARDDRRTRRLTRITRAEGWFRILGLPFMAPLLRAIVGDNPRGQLKILWRTLIVPILSVLCFLALWAVLAPKVQTSLGKVPGPAQVWQQAQALHADALREGEKRDAFYARQDARNAKLLAEGKPDQVAHRAYTGRPTFYSQIWTSIKTVFAGFLIGTLIAVPLGIAAGLSPTLNAAINPLVQIFKPVSPLAWLPLSPWSCPPWPANRAGCRAASSSRPLRSRCVRCGRR